ncbi:MAG: ACP S-malonyltransferase, partial [Desulfovibrio sp.]|nr:ACP S-malonyltransferase [Desulfovibrio sp.]
MPKAILLFPGQGSQTAGMGRALAEAKSWAMDFWKLGEKISGLPLREIYWEGDEAAMSNTRALQPALTVVNCNLYEAVRSKVSAVGAAGHSLGEFCALVAAHVLEAKDALSLTSLRGRLMAEADPKGDGGMLAVVKLDSSVVLEIVEEVKAELSSVLVAANFNTPFQTVLSGDKKALELAQSKVKARKGRAIALKVSGAFHSPLMAEANAEFGKILEKVTWHDASFPV